MSTLAFPRMIGLAACVVGGLATFPVGAEDAFKPVGQAFYGASFKDLKDQMASMDRYKGKVVVMYFWATWCVPCRVETPNLVKLDAEYKGKGKDVVVVG